MVRNEAALRGLHRLALLQLGISAVVVASYYIFSGQQAAVSAVLGCLLCIIPSQWFGARLFKHFGARAAKQIAAAFYTGEALKFLLTIGLFVVVFKWVQISAVAFFVSYIILQCSMWLAAVVI